MPNDAAIKEVGCRISKYRNEDHISFLEWRKLWLKCKRDEEKITEVVKTLVDAEKISKERARDVWSPHCQNVFEVENIFRAHGLDDVVDFNYFRALREFILLAHPATIVSDLLVGYFFVELRADELFLDFDSNRCSLIAKREHQEIETHKFQGELIPELQAHLIRERAGSVKFTFADRGRVMEMTLLGDVHVNGKRNTVNLIRVPPEK